MDEMDLGNLTLDALSGAIGNYAGGEVMELRRVLKERFDGTYAYESFAKTPHDPQARELLTLAVNQVADADADFSVQISDLLHHISMGPVATRTQSADRGGMNVGDIDGSGTVIVGPKGKNTVKNKISIHVGDKRYTFSFGGIVQVALVILFMAYLAGIFTPSVVGQVTSATPELTKNSACSEFMVEAPEVRDEAVRRIAQELGRVHGNFDLLNVQSACSGAPTRTLGDAIQSSIPAVD